MKYKYYFVATMCMLIGLSSCESNRQIIDDLPPKMYVNVVKFSSSDWLNYVAVEKEYMVNYEHICHIRLLNGRACEELYLGASPYISLPDDYYIIDWKWGDFIYPPTNFLIDVKWSEVEHRNQRWEYPAIYITSDFIKEWKCVQYKAIDTYLDINSPNDEDYIMPRWMDGYGYSSLQFVPEAELESYMVGVHYQDSLQNVYIGRLSQIIKEGALSKICD